LLKKIRMHRILLTTAIGASLLAVVACAAPFRERRTPSGEFCSDMAVIPAGQEPPREYHRLQPIASDPEARTEAERLESLRKAGCEAGADGVIEAVNEEIRTENGNWATVASGTAVTWVLRGTGSKPLTTHGPPPAPKETTPEPPPPEQPPAPEPTTTAAPPPPPAKTATPGALPPATPKVAPTAAPTSTAKPSLLPKKGK
jgi:hypothetical protein